MHKLVITKTGYERLDALHTLGLAIFIATAIGNPVKIFDCGISYELQFPKVPRKSPLKVFDELLKMPTERELSKIDGRKVSAKILMLDGLLAALFTTPGPRLVSVQDMLNKQKLERNYIERSLAKVSKAIVRWESFIAEQSNNMTPTRFWKELLSAYTAGTYALPINKYAYHYPINILMTLEPSLSYSTHRALSDGNVYQQFNTTIDNFPFAPLLAFIGAGRFLRAQRVNNGMVNLYVPMPANNSVNSRSTMPALGYSQFNRDIASLMVCMSLSKTKYGKDWLGIAYQTLQTQQMKQSISIDRKTLDVEWFHRVDKKLIQIWQSLYMQERKFGIELENLTDFLLSGSPNLLFAHLLECSLVVHERSIKKVYGYDAVKIKELLHMVDKNATIPLSTVLLNNKGTIRFGQALRQLRAKENGVLQGVIDDLERVKDVDALLLILSKAVEACVIQNANHEFTIIPDDQDLFLLLEDVESFGVPQIARVLIVLASLRYAKKHNIESDLALKADRKSQEGAQDEKV